MKRSSTLRAVTVGILGLCLLATLDTSVAGVRTEERGGRLNPATAKDWMPHPSKDDYYTESWTTVLKADSGHVLYISLLTTNIGVFKGQAALSVSHIAPGKKGKHYKWEYEPEKFKAEAGTIKVGPNSISLKGRECRLIIKEKDFTLDVTIKSWVDGVQFYYARTDVDRSKGQWTATWFHVPRGDVTGSVTIGGGDVALAGAGYVDHMVQNVLGGDYSTRWWALRHFGKDHTVVAIAFKAKKEAGGGMWLRTLVVDRSRVLMLTDKGSLKGSLAASDPDGYKYHTVFTLASQEGAVSVSGEFTGGKFNDRVSIMEELPWAQRQVAKMVAGNPIAYRMEGRGNARLSMPGSGDVVVEGPVLMESFVFAE